jgi:hypothetical protein
MKSDGQQSRRHCRHYPPAWSWLVAEPTSRAAPLCTVLSASLALGKLRWCAAWYKLFSTRELTLPGRPHLGTAAVLLHLYRRTLKASPARRVPQHFYRCPKRSFSLLLPRIPEPTACLPAFSHTAAAIFQDNYTSSLLPSWACKRVSPLPVPGSGAMDRS